MKKQKFLLLRGLPASGKSTLAKALVENEGYVRVNRDLLREMVHFNNWTPKSEKYIVDLEKAAAAYYAHEGYNVVIDDTNLSQRHIDIWSNWAKDVEKSFNMEVEFVIKDIDTPFEECVKRNLARGEKVPTDRILQMAMESGRTPDNYQYVICDMDGTLADNKWRTKFLYENPNGKKDWKRFHDGIPEDPVREDVLAQLKEVCAPDNVGLILVSARSEYCRGMTEDWLKKHNIAYDLLLMRRDDDHRNDELVKGDILNKYFPDKSKIIKVFDDRPRVIRMWREAGLDVVDVGDGIEF